MTRQSIRPQQCVALGFFALAVLLVAIVFTPGLAADFYLDSNKLFQLEDLFREGGWDICLEDILFGRFPGRVISQLTFYINIVIDQGIDARHIRLTNVAIHCLNALLVYLFSKQLMIQADVSEHSRLLAVGVALVWLVSPVNVAGVLYAVQRSNQLAAFFSLAALVFYLRLRIVAWRQQYAFFFRALLSVGVTCFTLVGYACKENAVLVPLFIVLTECFLAGPQRVGCYVRKRRSWIVCGLVLLAIVCLWSLSRSGLIDYQGRSFTMGERLWTEARVFWLYIGQLIAPVSSATGLFHDGLPISTGLLSPQSTGGAVIALGLLGFFLSRLWAHPELGVFAYGIAFFSAGHLLESTFLPLELYFEHRNYLPSVGVYLALAAGVTWLARRARPRLVGLFLLTWFAGLTIMANAKSRTWAAPEVAYTLALQRDYGSPRAASALAQIELESGHPDSALELLERVVQTAPVGAMRARLQQLYILCAVNASPSDEFYRSLAENRTDGPAIEISQALGNVVTITAVTGCKAVDVPRLVKLFQQISERVGKTGRDTWYIDYYIGQLMLTVDPQQAASWYAGLFRAEQRSAGLALQDLINAQPGLAIDAVTREKLRLLEELSR